MLRGECEAEMSTAPKKKSTGTGVTWPLAESLKKNQTGNRTHYCSQDKRDGIWLSRPDSLLLISWAPVH